jgi:hypothetical protein
VDLPLATKLPDISFLPPPPEKAADISFLPPPPPSVETVAPEKWSVPRQPEVSKNLPPAVPARPEGEHDPLFISDRTTKEEIGKIANKFGVDSSRLLEYAPYLGASVPSTSTGEALSNTAKQAAGMVGRGLLLNLPQFLAKKLEDDPNMRSAIDELQAVANERRNWAETIVENVALLPAAGALAGVRGAAAGAGKLADFGIREGLSTAGKAAALGSTAGLGFSKEGEEVSSTLTGAALGSVFGGAANAAKLYGITKTTPPKYSPGEMPKFGPAAEVESTIIKDVANSPQIQMDIEKGAAEVNKRIQKSEDLIQEAGLNRTRQLTPGEAAVVVEEQMGPKALEELTNPKSLLTKYAGEATSGEASIQKMASEIIDSRTKEFAEHLTGKKFPTLDKAIYAVKKEATDQGTEAIAIKYADFRNLKGALRHIEEEGLQAVNRPGAVGGTLNKLMEPQFVLRGIDAKYGGQAEKLLGQGSNSLNRLGFAVKKYKQDIHDIFRMALRGKVDSDIVENPTIWNAMRTGRTSTLSSEQREVAEGFSKIFKGVRLFARKGIKEVDVDKAPLPIRYRENYVPDMMLSTQEAIPAFEKQSVRALETADATLKRLITKWSDVSPTELNQLKNAAPEILDLVKGAALADRSVIRSGRDLEYALQRITSDRQGIAGLETVAGAALERKGTIPEFLLEKNLYKLATRYTNSTLKHIYMRDFISKMSNEASKLSRIGAIEEAAYVRQIVGAAVGGIREGTVPLSQMKARIALNKRIDRMKESLGLGRNNPVSVMLDATKAVPDMLSALGSQLYNNVLGSYSIRAATQNMSQSLTKVAPELGGSYGYETVVRAAAHTLANFSRLRKASISHGNVPVDFHIEGERAIAEGIMRSTPWRIPATTLAAVGKAGMKLFEVSEMWNRTLVTGVAEVLAADLAKGSSRARATVGKMPPYMQKALAGVEGNIQVSSELLSKYLTGVTQYHYNKLNMSEFGRTIGPTFSAFTKWPTATAGDIVQEFRNKPVHKASWRVFEKYMAPFLLLQGVDKVLLGEDSGDPDSLSDRQKLIAGKFGVSQMAPIGSLASLGEGQIYNNPLIDSLVGSIIKPLIKGESTKAKRGAENMAVTYLPTAGLFKFFFDDLITLVTGHRPQGDSSVERIQSGMRNVGRELDK